ncbi:hypothetical protein ACFQV2_03460 [Actinokineospora soli]|uniref:Uncharacterized protein n=1 Tax=Actinokineospora soli TaxID=1048753 RepID=A0ABW2THC6_9PSEU
MDTRPFPGARCVGEQPFEVAEQIAEPLGDRALLVDDVRPVVLEGGGLGRREHGRDRRAVVSEREGHRVAEPVQRDGSDEHGRDAEELAFRAHRVVVVGASRRGSHHVGDETGQLVERTTGKDVHSRPICRHRVRANPHS